VVNVRRSTYNIACITIKKHKHSSVANCAYDRNTRKKVKPLRYSPADLMHAHGCHYTTGGHGRIDVGGCYEGQKEATKEYARAR
jgi:hypothetical protein